MTVRSEVDKDAALELSLYIDNDSYMYGRRKYFVDNVKKRLKAGTYEHGKAWALWNHYVDEGARRYIKEYSTEPLQDTFNRSTRIYLAKEYANVALANIKSGEW